jgi:hypothetical protein
LKPALRAQFNRKKPRLLAGRMLSTFWPLVVIGESETACQLGVDKLSVPCRTFMSSAGQVRRSVLPTWASERADIAVVGPDQMDDVHNTSEVLFRLCANTDPPSVRYGAASP